MREAGSVINWTTQLPPLTKTTFPISALFDTTMSFGFTPWLEPALTVMLFLKANESYPINVRRYRLCFYSYFQPGVSKGCTVCSAACILYPAALLSYFLNWETCSSSCFLREHYASQKTPYPKKLLAELLQKQVAHCNGLIGTTQVILIRLESLGGKNKKN